MECRRCAACCIALDISTLGKGLGERCRHLTADNLCGIYAERPPVCRDYEPWDLCRDAWHPDEATRVARYLDAFGLAVPDPVTPPHPSSGSDN